MLDSALPSAATVEDIDRCLPQTQCTMCGFPRCVDYANSILEGNSDINRCPPGGGATLEALARLTGGTDRSLAEDCDSYPGRKVARIVEEICIGCTLCIPPCPLDAVIGTAKHMHTVVAADCSGCGLCLDHCPVDCIEMIEYDVDRTGQFWKDFGDDEVSRWRVLANRHHDRIDRGETLSVESARFADMKSEIREAVNRERSRRWKKAKRSARTKPAGLSR